MISTATILACVATLIISLILPAVLIIVYGVRHRGEGIWSAWLLGAAGFFVPQILIRLPLLNLAAGSEVFLALAREHFLLYGLLLAFTAGLFEVAGRYAAAMAMKRKLTFRRSLAAGLGHGGIEAMVIVGATYLNNLLYILMIRSGSFDALTAQAGAAAQQLEAIRVALTQTSWALFLAAGLERLLTMVCQAAMSMLVCYGVHTGHPLRGCLVCLGLHTLLDLTAVLAQLGLQSNLSQGVTYGILYVFLAGMALVSLGILKRIHARWAAEDRA